MKTSFRQLFSQISLSVTLAGGLMLTTAEAQTVKVRGQQRPAASSEKKSIDLADRHYAPSIAPWENDAIQNHSVSGEAGSASGGVQVKVLETRAGTYVNNGQNGFGAGVAGQAHLIRVTGGGQAQTGTIQVQGREILSNEAQGGTEIYVGARGFAESGVNFGKDPNVKVHAGGFVGENLSADGNIRTKVLGGGIGANGSASVGVGAEGSVGASVTKDGTKIGLGGFAGDRATVSGGVDLVGVGANVTADGYAGVGAEISSESSYQNGKLRIKGSLGAALGVGGRVGVDLTIDTNQIEAEGKALVDNVEHFGKQAVQEIDAAAQQADRDIKQAAAEVKQVFEQKIPNTFNQFGNDVKRDVTNAAYTVDRDVKQAAGAVQKTFEQTIPNAFNQFGNDANREINNAAKQMDQGLNKFGNDVGNAFSSLKFW